MTATRIETFRFDVGRLEMVAMDCWKCAVVFAISSDTYTRRRNDGEAFYCSNGHANYYTDTEEKRLRRKLKLEEQYAAELHESLRIERAEAELQRRRAAAYKGHTARYRRLISTGTCPCCRRNFENVRRHMASQHPDVLERVKADEEARP